MEKLVAAIVEHQPKQLTIGSHHYVSLAESDVLTTIDRGDLASVEMIVPTGTVSPKRCEVILRRYFSNLKVMNNQISSKNSLVHDALMTSRWC